ncbi:LOW QUALITY PROTEIN: tripartite motif-containing protein 16-like [Spinachia spinachia]
MAQQEIHLDQERISCSLCLDLLKDPVTIPCGHSYCMSCINTHWDTEDEKNLHSCPQCRQTFIPRPVLGKNTMLADLVEELKKNGLQAAPADHCYAGPEDVACDFCTRGKLKAVKSCLVCLASYCEKHLQPYYESRTFEKHKLVDPSKKLLENICSLHGEVKKIFCRTDQQSICYLCFMGEHKGHDTVSAAEERTERQRQLEVSRLNIQERIQEREKGVELFQQEDEKINLSAKEAVEDSEKIFNKLISLIVERSFHAKLQIASQQSTEVSRVKDLQEKLQQEISELKRSDAELQELSHTEDLNEFLQNYPAGSPLSESTGSFSINVRPLSWFEEVTAAVSAVRDEVEDVLRDKGSNVSPKGTEVDVLLTEPEPRTRDEFLQYSCKITLDPDTANTRLLLSEGNRRVTTMILEQLYPSNPDRFTDHHQVLSKESLTGRLYWEVKKGMGGIIIGVAYKDRESLNERFGDCPKSWALGIFKNGYEFRHNKSQTHLRGLRSSTVGVYLDQRGGILSFYSVTSIPKTMTFLCRVQTTFTKPLYAGIYLFQPVGNTAKLCELQSATKR